jgi:ABC-type amino acid transport substrate-binding protein
MMGLINNKCDMCIGAIKTDNTMAGIAFSTPYYYLSQRIVVLETQNVYDLIDLKDTYVGVLSNSLAEYIITEENKNLPSPIKLKTYQDVVNLFSDLKFGEIEALFIDSPVALWYSRSYLNKDFKVTDVAYKSGSYSIAVNNDNEELLKDINRALQKIDLREILDKYGLWDEAQESY